ncbi:MAG: RNA polymerase sigma factor [Ruminococcaceae bacterium]|nr:RNA polymerase sigma factor [Oscillospiraceae bacterium]
MDKGARCYHRFLEGDEGALEEIVGLYNRKLILFINNLTNNLSEAEDLAAEAFLDLILKKPHFRQESSFKTYLFSIGRNKALDFLKKQSRHTSVTLDDVQLADQNLLLDELEWGEQQKALLRALDELHPDYRDVLHLLYFEEMSYREAAAVLRKSEKQINNLAYRAKNAMRTAMQQEVT